jgi:hypothetical protein
MSDPSRSTSLEPAPLSEERERDFDEWVRHRLSGWSIAEIRDLDEWLVDESQLEFVPAVRGAWMKLSLDALDHVDSEEPAA